MSSPVTTMDTNGTLGGAAELMIHHHIGSVIVVEGKNPVGIITERDITKQVIKENDVLKKPVKQAMSKPPGYSETEPANSRGIRVNAQKQDPTIANPRRRRFERNSDYARHHALGTPGFL
jgi:CBS domain-containing protein